MQNKKNILDYKTLDTINVTTGLGNRDFFKNFNLTKFLKKYNNNINHLDDNNYNLLTGYIYNRFDFDYKIIDELIDNGINVQISFFDICKTEDFELIRYFIKKGYTVKKCYKYNKKYNLCFSHDIDIEFNTLSSVIGDYSDEYTYKILKFFFKNGFRYYLKKLDEESIPDSHQLSKTPLYWAMRFYMLDVIKLLLQNGANPNKISWKWWTYNKNEDLTKSEQIKTIKMIFKYSKYQVKLKKKLYNDYDLIQNFKLYDMNPYYVNNINIKYYDINLNKQICMHL